MERQTEPPINPKVKKKKKKGRKKGKSENYHGLYLHWNERKDRKRKGKSVPQGEKDGKRHCTGHWRRVATGRVFGTDGGKFSQKR